MSDKAGEARSDDNLSEAERPSHLLARLGRIAVIVVVALGVVAALQRLGWSDCGVLKVDSPVQV